jgi:selenocysteine lyase/cysteine desulfurase
MQPPDRDPLSALRAAYAADDALHLNNAGIAPLHPAAARSLDEMTALQRRGTLGIAETIGRVEAARATFARLTGGAPADVAFFSTCAAALTQCAFGVPLRAGDEVLLLDQEYPSNAYPWHRAAERAGASVRVVSSGPDLDGGTTALRAAITPRTRVVACSWVQFQTGTQVELPPLAEAVHRQGGLLVVDAIQGLGVLPFDLAAEGADLVCGGSQKWLLGPLGLGFLVARPGLAAQMPPLLHGAMTYGTPDDATDAARPARETAKRFEPGAPPIHAAVGTAAAAEALLAVGVAHVEQAARALADHLAAGLEARGYRLYPRGPRSPIVTFVPRRAPTALAADLRAARCAVAVRAGGLRVSPHAFLTREHIDRFLGLVDTLDAALDAPKTGAAR